VGTLLRTVRRVPIFDTLRPVHPSVRDAGEAFETSE
jgi:hypothetical protein